MYFQASKVLKLCRIKHLSELPAPPPPPPPPHPHPPPHPPPPPPQKKKERERETEGGRERESTLRPTVWVGPIFFKVQVADAVHNTQVLRVLKTITLCLLKYQGNKWKSASSTNKASNPITVAKTKKHKSTFWKKVRITYWKREKQWVCIKWFVHVLQCK